MRAFFAGVRRPVNLCVDIQSAVVQRAGVGRYTKCLVEAFGQLTEPGDQLRLFFFDFKRQGPPFPVSGATFKRLTWCPGRLVQRAWKTAHFPPFDWLAGAADVFLFPNFVVPPLVKGKAVVTIHDASFLNLPETTERKNLNYLKAQMPYTVKRADLILTVSQASADDICAHLDVAPEKVRAVHLGLTENMRRPEPDTIARMRKQYDLERPYLLFVGTLEPRKNIPFLIEVFEQLTAFDGDLVIAGMKGWSYEPILARMQQSPQRERIRYLEYVDEQWLPALYAGADCFLFPSLYEGFGFPPLEAMKCGTPVVASCGGSLPEVLGAAADLIPEFDSEAWVTATTRLLTDQKHREQYQTAGLRHAATFSWAETARKTWTLIQQVGA